MSTIAPIRTAFVPYRRDEIIAIAQQLREQFGSLSIDEVAEREGIILLRSPDANASKAGASFVLKRKRRKRIASVARPGSYLFSFVEKEVVLDYAIVINPLCCQYEEEVFWHEYYHLFYSPSRKGGTNFSAEYSTSGVLDKQEEWRANLFAAYILIDCIESEETQLSIGERYNVSPQLVNLRLNSSCIYQK